MINHHLPAKRITDTNDEHGSSLLTLHTLPVRPEKYKVLFV